VRIKRALPNFLAGLFLMKNSNKLTFSDIIPTRKGWGFLANLVNRQRRKIVESFQ